MRYLALIALILAACNSPKSDTLSVQAAFIPSQCTFSQTLTNDARFTGLGITDPVNEYSCAIYNKMTCTAYAIDEEYLGLDCEVTNTAQPQGVPSGCTLTAGTGFAAGANPHGFLDEMVLYAKSYSCGTLNGNLRCSYHSHPGTVCGADSDATFDADFDGNPTNDCADGQDDRLHEEIRCHLL